MGQVTFQEGFFSVARTCSRCRGTGRIIQSKCKGCSGEGRVAVQHKRTIPIPAGVDNGSQLRVEGEGEPGSAGGPPGDLYVVVRVREHEFFRRDGTNLYCEVPIGLTQAVLGARLELPTLDGGKAAVDVPEGTQSGETFRLRGQGIPNLGGRGRGDLHVTVRVVIPRKLTAERVALGRAIVRDPKVFLFDEPLSNLDAALRVSTRNELVTLHQRLGATMIYVTHDQVEAMTMGTRICIINQGKVVQIGPPLEFYRRPKNTFVAAFLGSPPMNLLGAKLDRVAGTKRRLRLGGQAVELPDPWYASETHSGEVLFGIRPEDIFLPDSVPSYATPATSKWR